MNHNLYKLIICIIFTGLILGVFTMPVYASENNKEIRGIRKVLIVPEGRIGEGIVISKELNVSEVAEGIPPALKGKVTEDMLPYVYEEIIYEDEEKIPEETQEAMKKLGADIAEYYPVLDESIEAGDVVSISNRSGLIVSTTSTKYLIEKSSQPYDQNLIGVISGDSAIIINKGDGSEPESEAILRPVALTGRVLVKVFIEDGSIEIGDYLTSSEVPGFAKKATESGKVIGMALESLSDVDLELGYGKIMVFMNVGWYGEGSSTKDSSITGTISNLFASILEQFKNLGVFIEQNLVRVKRLITAALVIEKGPVSEENTIGEGTILSGNQEITIYNNNVGPTSKIFVTFRGDYQNRWWASEIEQGFFKIALSDISLQDIAFDYWIVGVGEAVLEGNLGLAPEELNDNNASDIAIEQTPTTTEITSTTTEETSTDTEQTATSSESSATTTEEVITTTGETATSTEPSTTTTEIIYGPAEEIATTMELEIVIEPSATTTEGTATSSEGSN